MTFDLGLAAVHEADVAVGARDGHELAVDEGARGITGAEHRRQSQLSAHDRCVRGAATAIGHDGGRPPHHRTPVRIGDRGDEHSPIGKSVRFGRTRQPAHGSAGSAVAHGEAAHQHRAVVHHAIAGHHRGRPLCLHRFGSGLHDEHLPRQAVPRPFDVHGPPVVALDGNCPFSETDHLGVTEHPRPALDLRRLDQHRRGRDRHGHPA